MYRDRVIEIGKKLGELAESAVHLRDALARTEAEISAQETALMPDGGWPGSNAEARKASQLLAFASDEKLVALNASAANIKTCIMENTARSAPLEAERRALEFAIRDREVDAVANLSAVILNRATYAAPTPAPAPSPAPLPFDPGKGEIVANTPAKEQLLKELGLADTKPAPVRTVAPPPAVPAVSDDLPF